MTVPNNLILNESFNTRPSFIALVSDTLDVVYFDMTMPARVTTMNLPAIDLAKICHKPGAQYTLINMNQSAVYISSAKITFADPERIEATVMQPSYNPTRTKVHWVSGWLKNSLMRNKVAMQVTKKVREKVLGDKMVYERNIIRPISANCHLVKPAHLIAATISYAIATEESVNVVHESEVLLEELIDTLDLKKIYGNAVAHTVKKYFDPALVRRLIADARKDDADFGVDRFLIEIVKK